MESTHTSSHDSQSNESSVESNAVSLVADSKAAHQRLFKRGIGWLCVGVFLMALSFGINFFLFHSTYSFTTMMYLLTTLGTVCIVKSLADILGF